MVLELQSVSVISTSAFYIASITPNEKHTLKLCSNSSTPGEDKIPYGIWNLPTTQYFLDSWSQWEHHRNGYLPPSPSFSQRRPNKLSSNCSDILCCEALSYKTVAHWSFVLAALWTSHPRRGFSGVMEDIAHWDSTCDGNLTWAKTPITMLTWYLHVIQSN